MADLNVIEVESDSPVVIEVGFQGPSGQLEPEDRARVTAAVEFAAVLDAAAAKTTEMRDEAALSAAAAAGHAGDASANADRATAAAGQAGSSAEAARLSAQTAAAAPEAAARAADARGAAEAAATAATADARATAADRAAVAGAAQAAAASEGVAAAAATTASDAAAATGQDRLVIEAHRTAVEHSISDFGARWLGVREAPPEGPQIEGALYYDSLALAMFVRRGGQWHPMATGMTGIDILNALRAAQPAVAQSPILLARVTSGSAAYIIEPGIPSWTPYTYVGYLDTHYLAEVIPGERQKALAWVPDAEAKLAYWEARWQINVWDANGGQILPSAMTPFCYPHGDGPRRFTTAAEVNAQVARPGGNYAGPYFGFLYDNTGGTVRTGPAQPGKASRQASRMEIWGWPK